MEDQESGQRKRGQEKVRRKGRKRADGNGSQAPATGRGKREERMMQDRRAAPVSKVFTIPAKNKVQRPGGAPSSSLSRRNWQQKAESPSAHSLPSMGARHSRGEGRKLREGRILKRERKRERVETPVRGRGVVLLVLLVAIYGRATSAYHSQRYFQEPSLSSAGHLLRLQGEYGESFFARRDPCTPLLHCPRTGTGAPSVALRSHLGFSHTAEF